MTAFLCLMLLNVAGFSFFVSYNWFQTNASKFWGAIACLIIGNGVLLFFLTMLMAHSIDRFNHSINGKSYNVTFKEHIKTFGSNERLSDNMAIFIVISVVLSGIVSIGLTSSLIALTLGGAN